MFPVAVHDNTLAGRHAVIREQAVQVFQDALFHGPCHDQQLAAAAHIIGQHILFLRGDVAGGGIDHDAVGLLGDLVHSQQGQLAGFHVLLFDLLGKVGGQFRLAVSLQDIDLGVLLAGDIVDSGGNGALAVKGGGVVGAGVDVDLAEVDVLKANIAALIAALHDQTVVLDSLAGVLLGEGGVDVGVLLDDLYMVGEAFIFAQQVLDDLVLLAGLDDPIDGHILLQGVDHHFGVAGDRVELGGADIILGHGGGQRGHKDIHHHQDRQEHCGHGQGIGAALQRLPVFFASPKGQEVFQLFHQLYLRFSRDWTDRNRKNTITLRKYTMPVMSKTPLTNT